MKNKQELTEQYSTLLNTLDDKTISELHLKSINNFLLHFDSLKYKDQLTISEKLETYIDTITQNKHVLTSEPIDSLKLFTDYVNPIGVIYQQELDFGVVTPTWINLTNFIIIVVFCLFVQHIFVFTSISLFLLWYFYRQYNRRKLFKFYKYKY
jgi:hypothetical protein